MVVEFSHCAAMIFGVIFEFVGVNLQLNSDPPSIFGKFYPIR